MLHLAFPRANLPFPAILALGGLFACWMSLSPRTALWVGYVNGIVFFALNCSWIGETAGALLGRFAFILDIGPALLEALSFAIAAAVVAWAARHVRAPWVPLVATCAFTAAEWVRSSGALGFPMYQIGTPFVETWLAPIAAFAGGYGITFAVAFVAAALGALFLRRDRNATVFFIASCAGVAVLTAGAHAAWPARTIGPATIRVAAVQANIAQKLKWDAPAFALAVDRYTAMTASLAVFKPQIVLWPETVITTRLNEDPALEARFGALAKSLNTTLIVGSVEDTNARLYDDLFFFDRTGALESAYRKRQLVPFAEYLPGPRFLRNLPFGDLPSDYSVGTSNAVIDTQYGIAPLICWESPFGDLAQAQAANGARMFVIATDDAWFGASDGPYVHAQIAVQRAVETGRWVLRAGATGISGVIAPDGTWRARSGLQTQEVVTGMIGDPQPTVYSRIGPHPFGIAFTVFMFAGMFAARRRNR